MLRNLIRFQSQLNLSLAVSQPNQISSLKKNEPEELELLITLLIESVASSLNTKNTLSANQLDECVMLLIEKYWMLRPEEIMYVFKNAKLGKYGSDYNRIDILTISGWINRYIDEERAPHFEMKNRNLEPELISREEFDKQYEEFRRDNQENPEKYAEIARQKREEERKEKIKKFLAIEKEAEFKQFSEDYYKNRKSPETEKIVSEKHAVA